ncbi:MAG: PilT/PilU family type 4a pilus ATPase [Candidatus Gygaella obscura]|nr:PilT/PilU family type 4a pilus ATPase [Candidatus Gygaella obscura]
MDIKKYLDQMVEKNASDLFIRVGGPVRMRIAGRIFAIDTKVLELADVKQAISDLTTPEQLNTLETKRDVDFAITMYVREFDRRFRASIFHQRNTPAIVIRLIRHKIDTFKELLLPSKVLTDLSLESRGMILFTGTTGSGKSTALASMIEYINNNCQKHILTLEEPIEFVFRDKVSIINQRELGMDVSDYSTALRAFTLQSPDVIFIGNIRDQETMFAAVNAAETGVLVLSTLHTVNAMQTIERIINFFPPYQHSEIRMQLSLLLKGVISLRLAPTTDGTKRVPACEVMVNTPTVSRLIREGKTWEIPQYIEQGELFGMQTFNQSLAKLVKEGSITEEVACDFSDNKDEFYLMLKGIKKGH